MGRARLFAAIMLVPPASGAVPACFLAVHDVRVDGVEDARVDRVDGARQPPDSTTPTDGAANDAESGSVNLVQNGDFERGCQEWNAFAATLSETDIALSGTRGCLVCGTGNDFGIIQNTKNTVTLGVKYFGEAQVRSAEDASVPDGLYLQLTLNAGADTLESSVGNGVLLTPAWSRMSAVLTAAGDGGTDLALSVGAQSPGCFVIDDARVHPQ